ncbi:MAG: hypothetical protein ACHWZW_22230 [Spirulina sp.]
MEGVRLKGVRLEGVRVTSARRGSGVTGKGIALKHLLPCGAKWGRALWRIVSLTENGANRCKRPRLSFWRWGSRWRRMASREPEIAVGKGIALKVGVLVVGGAHPTILTPTIAKHVGAGSP